MADSNKVDINFNAETSRARGEVRKFKGEIEAVGSDGKKSAAAITGSFKTIEGAIGRVRKAIRTISFSAMLIDAVASLVAKFNDWRNAAAQAAEKTRELQKAAADKAAAEGVREIATAYKELSQAIADASEQRSRQNELFNEKKRIQREAEDAEMEAAEAEELAGVDQDAEDADRTRSEIRDRYAAKRARRNAERKKLDVLHRREEYAQQAQDLTSAADQIEASLSADDKAISRTRQKAATLEAFSEGRNEKDGTWYNPRKRTDEGDKVRERQRQEAEKLREQVKKLEADRAEKERQIQELRGKAAHANDMRNALGDAYATADMQISTATMRGETAQAANRAAREKEKEKRRDEEAKRASALAASDSLADEKRRIEDRIAAEQARKDAAGMAVYQAQGAYDATKLGGNRAAQQSAFGNLQSAQLAAQDVNHSADSAINALTETLKSIEARLKAAQNELKKQSGQSKYAWSEASSGE